MSVSPERHITSTSSQSSVSPVDNYGRYEDNFASAGPPPVTNGYDNRRGSSQPSAPPMRAQNDAPGYYGNKGGYSQPGSGGDKRDSYAAPQSQPAKVSVN